MKKILLLAAFASFTFVGCGDDDNTTSDSNNTPVASVNGKWKLVKAEYVANGEVEIEDLKSATCDYDFYDLKTGGLKDEVYHDESDNCNPDNWPGTWSYNESNKYITMIDSDDNYTVVFQVVSLTTTEMKIKVISDDGEELPAGYETFAYLKR